LFSAVLIARLNSLVGALPGPSALGALPGVTLLHAGAQALELAPPALRPVVTEAVTRASRKRSWSAPPSRSSRCWWCSSCARCAQDNDRPRRRRGEIRAGRKAAPPASAD